MFRRRLPVRKTQLLFTVAVILSILIIYNITELAQSLLKEHEDRKSHSKDNVRIPQVVGHYVGNGNLFQISNKEFLNTNEFEPIPGAGELGKPVVIPPKDILKMQHYFQLNRYNLMASDRMPLNRTVPDVRRDKCISKQYPTGLPNTSIIIVFHNEAWSVLLRTVWSVIYRSPRELLKEIFLVDDASTRTFLKEELDEYVKLFPVPTKVLRLHKREGLIAARMLGARAATGETLTFLDAHCECSPGWLEPLVARVAENRQKIVCPVIDIISDDNFSYIKSFEFHWGAFNWELHFRWYSLGDYELGQRKSDVTEPFHTPTMAGGLFTVDRNYFFEVGAYDEAMKIWGGDNLEMSFRVWQCGGEIEIAPCSHVGHLFRKSSPYTFPGGVGEILNRNLARLATVWMDDWGKFFFYFNEEANNLHLQSDVSDRVTLRKELQCKNFSWYLNNVWPQHFFPTDERFFGRIQPYRPDMRHLDTYKELLKENNLFYLKNRQAKYQKLLEKETNSMCIQRPASNNSMNQPYGRVGLKKCTATLKKMEEMFIITSDGQILTNEGICFNYKDEELETEEKEETIFAKMTTCNYKNRQKWLYDTQTLQIKHRHSEKCLAVESHETVMAVIIKKCDATDNSQKWILFPVKWH